MLSRAESVAEVWEPNPEYLTMFKERPQDAAGTLARLRDTDDAVLPFLRAFSHSGMTAEQIDAMAGSGLHLVLIDMLCDVRWYEFVADPRHAEIKDSSISVCVFSLRCCDESNG